MILDYVRHHGEADIGGIQFVGGVTKLGSEAAAAVLTPEFLAWVPGFFSTDADESIRSLGALLRLWFSTELQAEEFFLALGWSVRVMTPNAITNSCASSRAPCRTASRPRPRSAGLPGKMAIS